MKQISMADVLLLMFATWVLFVASVLGLSTSNDDIRKEFIYTTCNTSRMSQEIKEHECERLLDLYGYNFECEQRNRLANNHCRLVAN